MGKLISALAAVVLFSSVPQVLTGQTREVVAYYPEWGLERHGYLPKNLEKSGAADRLTVLIYAFSEPGPDSTGAIQPKFMSPYEAYQRIYSDSMSVDGAADDSLQPLRGQFNQIRKLKERHPNLRVLISVGGWTGSGYLSDALMTPQSREKFADATIDRFILGNLPVERGGGGKGAAAGIFDGVDIDWEYPQGGGMPENHYSADDKENLTAFYSLLRAKLDSINPKLILTAAVPASREHASHYNITGDQKYLNWYNLMTYDYAGGWSSATNHHANLLTSPEDTSGPPQSLDSSVRLFLDSLAVKSSKIVPGAAFYGRGWTGVDPTDHGLYQPASGAAGISDSGVSSYYSSLQSLYSKGYTYYWDTLAMAPTLYSPKDSVFWSFDDAKSVALKYHYIEAYHLGGLMCWEISGDDSAGTLVKAMATGRMPYVTISEPHPGKSRPSIEIVTRAAAAGLVEGSSVVIDTRVSDKGGNVVRVEFFVDGKSIGYDTTPPFDWVWFNVPPGRHEIKAVGTDDNGESAAASVGVTVKSVAENR